MHIFRRIGYTYTLFMIKYLLTRILDCALSFRTLASICSDCAWSFCISAWFSANLSHWSGLRDHVKDSRTYLLNRSPSFKDTDPVPGTGRVFVFIMIICRRLKERCGWKGKSWIVEGGLGACARTMRTDPGTTCPIT